MALVGYARVSTEDQALDSQLDDLKVRCGKVFTDKMSGKKADRPGLKQCLDYLRPGDTLVVTKLDRLARSVADLVQIMSALGKQGIEFTSIHDNIETNTPHGKFIFHVFGAIAELESGLASWRTRQGLNAARSRGRLGGRKKKMTQEKVEAAMKLLSTEMSPGDVARQLGVSRATLYQYFPGGKARIAEGSVSMCRGG